MVPKALHGKGRKFPLGIIGAAGMDTYGLQTGRRREKDAMAVPDPNLTLAVVFESSDPVALSVVSAAFDEAGIEFVEIEEALLGYAFSPILNPVCRIQVAQTSEPQAREILKDLFGVPGCEDGEDSALDGWTGDESSAAEAPAPEKG
jgi:Putative prokaryotic signal transducing protein